MYIPTTYTVENVRKGHPDKICDQISDAILDAYLKEDPRARVAIESFGAHGLLTIGGEITSSAQIDVEHIARTVYRSLGFDSPLEVVLQIAKQSTEIATGVDRDGAGDQGIMYGYATNETPEFLPRAVVYSARIVALLDTQEIQEKLPWLRPDGKTQVTIANDVVTTVVVSVQHTPEATAEIIREGILTHVLRPIFGSQIDTIECIINPSGQFTIGGFDADTGLTGRKIMIDTYGGIIPHGGGCFSGKDATKVDRSAAYMARYAAKSMVAAGLSSQVLVSVAYAIGKAEPVMVQATGAQGEDLTAALLKQFDFRPQAIIAELALRTPLYASVAAYGHFIHADAPWEQVKHF